MHLGCAHDKWFSVFNSAGFDDQMMTRRADCAIDDDLTVLTGSRGRHDTIDDSQVKAREARSPVCSVPLVCGERNGRLIRDSQAE